MEGFDGRERVEKILLEIFWNFGGCWGEPLEEEVIVVCHTGVVECCGVVWISCESEEDFLGVFVFLGSSCRGGG